MHATRGETEPDRVPVGAGASFADGVHAIQRELNGLPHGMGADRVLWPGQPEAERTERGRAEGVPLPAAVAADLERLGGELASAGGEK
jgi:LDH2 family malate/lactate/ureidoglycolate dehydrogenase